MFKILLCSVVIGAHALTLGSDDTAKPIQVKQTQYQKYEKGMAQFVVDPQRDMSKFVKWSYNPWWAAGARTKLMQAPYIQHTGNFDAVEQSFGVMPQSELDHSQWRSVNEEGNKNLMKVHGGNCVVYGAGIADDSSLEESMAEKGCEVHSFDCTLKGDEAAVKGKKFTFHNWCLGTPASFEQNTYTKDQKKDTKYEFKSVSEAMKELGHSKLDVLKFDIEGFEWNLFENDLLNGLLTTKQRPKQLSFELHTEGASPAAVPEGVVKGKNYESVNKLFSKLYDLGYRVISKEQNPGDRACAEFVLVDVFNL